MLTTKRYTFPCKQARCSELLEFTTPRKQKSKTTDCKKGHKHTYSLSNQAVQRHFKAPTIKMPSIKSWTLIIVAVSVLAGFLIGALLIPFLNWVFPVQIWSWVIVVWVIAWGCLGGSIAFNERNRT